MKQHTKTIVIDENSGSEEVVVQIVEDSGEEREKYARLKDVVEDRYGLPFNTDSDDEEEEEDIIEEPYEPTVQSRLVITSDGVCVQALDAETQQEWEERDRLEKEKKSMSITEPSILNTNSI